MAWQGKVLGGVIGFFGGGPVGALLGAVVGHQFDARTDRRQAAAELPGGSPYEIQQAFFQTTFEVMGHLAKADGRVSPEEIRAARAVMQELRLGERDVERAIAFFTAGKQPDFPLEARLRELRRLAGGRADLMRTFVLIQLKTALSGDGLDMAVRAMLQRICSVLGVSAFELLQLEALLRMQRATGAPGAGALARGSVQRLTEAYRVLGVDRNANDAEVTRAYRRLMSQNHPDKLVAKGLPESMMRVAQERTAQIRAAYETIRESRGLR
jgi:DnaJ like chaperone protein